MQQLDLVVRVCLEGENLRLLLVMLLEHYRLGNSGLPRDRYELGRGEGESMVTDFTYGRNTLNRRQRLCVNRQPRAVQV